MDALSTFPEGQQGQVSPDSGISGAYSLFPSSDKFAQINLSLEGNPLYYHSPLPCKLRTQTLVLIAQCRREVRYETERKQYSNRPDVAYLLYLRPRYTLGWDKSILLDGRMIRGAATLHTKDVRVMGG